ncbi:hypothetical protein [Streptomyces sp. NPDC054887]
MWVGLDAVDWASLEHNYGTGQDVPGLLRRCAGPDPDDAEDAASDLLNHLFHQGGWICSAASAALPFVLRLAATPAVPSRLAMLELTAMLAAEAGRAADRFLDPGWAPAWERALPDVLALLDDPEAELRRAAADVIGACASPGQLLLPGLLRRWQVEEDPATRLELVLALGHASRREPAGVRGDEAHTLLRDLLGAPQAQLRLAAVHALAPSDPGLPAQRLPLLIEAVRDPSVDLWRHTSSVRTGVRGVHHWTGKLIDGPSPSFALGLFADHSDEEQRVGALAQAGAVLSQWRSPTAALLPRIAARLEDPATEARFLAAELLACVGSEAAAHADEVAALLTDTSARTTRRRQTVAEAALWALARMNDPRCLPGLIDLLTGEGSGFASASAHYPAGDWHYAALPAIDEVLSDLSDHSAVLLPALCDRLAPATDGLPLVRLCGVVESWGPAAAAAVPRLLVLLEDDRTWEAAARALASIGSAASAAREPLLARTATGGVRTERAAWAYWKVGGEPGPAMEALARALGGGGLPHPALAMLADLGEHAAPCAGELRALTAGSDPWTRVEAAHALWAATGDPGSSVPVLTAAVGELGEGTYRPVMLPAVRHLARTGRAAGSASSLLRGVPALDRRLRCDGGWRGFTQDETIRAAVHDLLAAAGQPA